MLDRELGYQLKKEITVSLHPTVLSVQYYIVSCTTVSFKRFPGEREGETKWRQPLF